MSPLTGRPRVLPEELRERIRSMHAAGMSLTAIAERLNAEGVPTAHGGRRWWHPTIARIVGRASRGAGGGGGPRRYLRS